MLYEMKLRTEEFNNIKYNNKIMEVRLNDKKRKKIKAGDNIVFYKLPELTESVLVKVEKIYKFLTFKELYDEFPSSYFGYNNLDMYGILSKIYSIYSHKQEEENGVIAIMFHIEEGR